jgi:hypothetical protein
MQRGRKAATQLKLTKSAKPDATQKAGRRAFSTNEPLLQSLSNHVATADALSAQVDVALAAKNWSKLAKLTKKFERESRAIASLSGKLKLTPASTHPAPNRPWEIWGEQ